MNPGAQNANIKEKAVGIHLLPEPVEVGLAELVRLVRELHQQTLQTVERRFDFEVAGLASRFDLPGGWWPVALSPRSASGIAEASLLLGMIELDQQSLRAVEVVAENDDHHPLPRLRIDRHGYRRRLLALPLAPGNEGHGNQQRACGCPDRAAAKVASASNCVSAFRRPADEARMDCQTCSP